MNRTRQRCDNAPNPVLKANIISKWTFWWLRDLLRKGFSRPLNEDEIYGNKPWLDSESNTTKLNDLWQREVQKKSPSMLRVFLKAYGLRILILDILYCSLEIATRLLQPLCLGGLVTYFVPGQTTVTREIAFVYATVIVLCSLVPALVFHSYILYLFQIARKLSVGCAGLIYDKILKLSKASSNDGLSGRAINILSNDLSKFDLAVCFAHHLWKGPLEAVLLTYFMYQEMGVSALIGVAFMLAFIPLQSWAAKKAAYYRRLAAERTDFRVKLMNEIIQGIQVIKMYAWEGSFASVIAKVRRKEINVIRGTLRIHAGLLSITTVPRVSIFLTILSFITSGDILTAKKVFIVSSFFNSLKDSMVFFWPLGLMFIAEGLVSIKRVQEFLQEKEDRVTEKKQDEAVTNGKENGTVKEHSKTSIEIVKFKTRRTQNLHTKSKSVTLRDASTAWECDVSDIMKDYNIEVENSSLVAIVGPVGSGKSSMLNVIIGELELRQGFVIVNGSISYACQEPWIFEGTVRDNIVFIDEYDENHYRDVIRVCALERDFELFSHGDKTPVGERGVSLSGGQKARISLARTIYRKADIYLLDDPLSAVDAQVGRHIFDNCIKTFLKDKTVLLVTHQLQYLRDVEHVVLINGGRIVAQGSYQNLQKNPDFKFLANTHDESGDDLEKVEKEFSEVTKTEEKKMATSAGTSYEDEVKEHQATGSVSFQVYMSYFKSIDQYPLMFFVFFLFLVARGVLAGVDYYLSRWVIWEETIAANRTESLFDSTNTTTEGDSLIEGHREVSIISYSLLLGSGLILHLMRTFGFYAMCVRISLNLHDRLFRGITRAKMRFFNTNPSGRILNRFSKDIHTIDAFIPDTMIDCISFFVDFAAVLAIVVVVNYWLLVPTVIITILFYLMRTVYVNCGRSIKRMEAISRSPLFSHTNQTLQGITTIRSFGAESILKEEFHYFQNQNSAAYYLFLASTRAFAFWLDIVCVMYIGVVTYSFLILEDQFQSGDVGLAIMQTITMIGMCQWGMRQTAELENQMTSVERVIEYVDETPEPPLETSPEHHIPVEWPNKGAITFDNMSLKYSEHGDQILKDLNFAINDKEKIGIVGRTGAGKSSIIQAMFRLAINEGTIFVDDVDIGSLGLHDLRSKISIIPQDPILFSGTLRYNLDPFEAKSDADLWKTLEEVELKSYVMSLAGGLNSKMSDGGSNFSMGQRQLVCLARAILRDNKILILDEATANVDPETDKLIQQAIRTKFADCTVLTIAHRLHTVMDSDRVLVMDAGRAVEFGPPYELLLKEDGHLRHLVNKTGNATAAILMGVAKSSYKENDASAGKSHNE